MVSTARIPRRLPQPPLLLLLVLILVILGGAGRAVWTNTLGAGERFHDLVERVRLAVDPPPGP